MTTPAPITVRTGLNGLPEGIAHGVRGTYVARIRTAHGDRLIFQSASLERAAEWRAQQINELYAAGLLRCMPAHVRTRMHQSTQHQN